MLVWGAEPHDPVSTLPGHWVFASVHIESPACRTSRTQGFLHKLAEVLRLILRRESEMDSRRETSPRLFSC